MGFVENNLMPNEKIVAWAEHHWWGLVGPIVWVSIGIGISLTPLWNKNNDIRMISVLLGAIVAFVAIFILAGDLITYYTSEYAVTNKKIVMKVGWIRRTTLEVFLGRIEGFSVDQGIVGRIFNFGTIVISTGGVSQSFHLIADPMTFRKQAQEEIARVQEGG